MPRFISMKNFRDDKSLIKCRSEKVRVPVGQIIGHVSAVKEKVKTNPDGSQQISWLAFGEFEAVVYATGEVLQTGQIYLPSYYAEELQAVVNQTGVGGDILFGIEVALVPTGKQPIDYAWDCTNITGMARSKPLEQLKRHLHQRNLLRIPLQSEAAPAIEHAPADGEDAPEEEDAEPSPHAKGKNRKAA